MRRRRRQFLLGGAGVVVAGGVLVAGPVAGLVSGGVLSALNYGFQGMVHYRRLRHIVLRIPTARGERLNLTPFHIQRAELVQSDTPQGWALSVAHRGSGTRVHWSPFEGLRMETPTTELAGEEAVRAARMILPKLNTGGGSRSTVQDAVRLLEDARGPEACFAAASRGGEGVPAWRSTMLSRRPRMQRGNADALRNLPVSVRLALEMAAHEEIERRALEGELALLEDAWREAEEVAAIADNMFLPENVHQFMEKHRRS